MPNAQSLPEEAPWRENRPDGRPVPAWRAIALRIRHKLTSDNLSIVAAGAAFYLVLAVFPALTAAVSLYGLASDPGQIDEQFAALAGILPEQARSVLVAELSRVASQPGGVLSFGALAGVALALWSARKGMEALIQSLNIIHESVEGRNFLRRAVLSVGLTLAGVAAFVAALALAAAWPVLMNALPLPAALQHTIDAIRWPLLAGIVVVSVAVLYRFGPYRKGPDWRDVIWGALTATALWIVGSMVLSVYIAHFGHYNKTYGSVGAVMVLLFWFYFSSFVILLGAELNAALERIRT